MEDCGHQGSKHDQKLDDEADAKDDSEEPNVALGFFFEGIEYHAVREEDRCTQDKDPRQVDEVDHAR